MVSVLDFKKQKLRDRALGGRSSGQSNNIALLFSCSQAIAAVLSTTAFIQCDEMA